MYFLYYLQFFTLTLKSSIAKIVIIYFSTRNLPVLYVKFSDKCLQLSQKWPLYYFQAILAPVLVTIATIKVKLISDFRSEAVLLLWIFYVFFGLLFAMPLYVSVYMCLVVAFWERADLLALVCGVLL